MNDYTLWKIWWLATLYGASPETRMALIDRVREAEK